MTMRFIPSRRAVRIAAVTVAMLALLVPGSAPRADLGFVYDVESAIDATGELPFKLVEINDLMTGCETGDPVSCADSVANSSEAKSMGADDTAKAFAIYFDIKGQNYWGLVEDAGEIAACAVASLFTGGVPVCGLLSDIADAAEAVYGDAKAVVQFLADLGESISDAVKDVGCALGLGGCNSASPTPPSPDQLAAGYYASLVANKQGLSYREQSADTWKTYAVGSPGTDPTVFVGAIVPHQGLVDQLPTFVKNVYTQWDQDMVHNNVPTVTAFEKTFKSPAKVAADVSLAMTSVQNIDWLIVTPDFNSGLRAFLQLGANDCKSHHDASGANKVHDWLADKSDTTAPNFSNLWDPNLVCPAFDQQLEAGLKVQLRTPLMSPLLTPGQYGGLPPCSQTGGGPAYTCGSAYAAHCNDVTTFLDGKKECSTQGAGKIPFYCTPPHGKPYYETLSLDQPRPMYCKPAQVNQPPPASGGGRLQ